MGKIDRALVISILGVSQLTWAAPFDVADTVSQSASDDTVVTIHPAQRREDARWARERLSEDPLVRVARELSGRPMRPEVALRSDTSILEVRQSFRRGGSLTQTQLRGAFTARSRLELPGLAGLDSDTVEDMLKKAMGQQATWASAELSDGSLAYTTTDQAMGFRVWKRDDALLVDSYHPVVEEDALWRAAVEVLEVDDPWRITERWTEGSSPLVSAVGVPAGVEQDFQNGAKYTRRGGYSVLTIPSQADASWEDVVSRLMTGQTPSHGWGQGPWQSPTHGVLKEDEEPHHRWVRHEWRSPQQDAAEPGTQRIFVTVDEGAKAVDSQLGHVLPFWIERDEASVVIRFSPGQLMANPLFWHLVDQVVPMESPRVKDNGWLGEVTDDYRVGWSGRGGQFCQSFSQSIELCTERDQMSPMALYWERITFDTENTQLSHALLSGLVHRRDDQWHPKGIAEEMSALCHLTVDRAAYDVECQAGDVQGSWSVNPF